MWWCYQSGSLGEHILQESLFLQLDWLPVNTEISDELRNLGEGSLEAVARSMYRLFESYLLSIFAFMLHLFSGGT